MDILEEVYHKAYHGIIDSSMGPTMQNKVTRMRKAILESPPGTIANAMGDVIHINHMLDQFYSALGTDLNSVATYMLYLPGLDVQRMRKDAIDRMEPAYYGVTIRPQAQQILEELFVTYHKTIYDMFVANVLDIMVPRMSVVTRRLSTGLGNIMLTNLGYPYLWVPFGIYLREQGLSTASYNLSKYTQGMGLCTSDPHVARSPLICT